MKNQKIMGLLAFLLVLATLLVITPVVVQAATERSSTGSFTLNATPSVSGVDFQDDSYVTDTALDPATVWQRLNFTVSSSAGMSDIKNVTIWIFDDSTHGADYNTTAVDGIFIAEFLWVEATDTWSVSDQGSMTEWAVDNANSDDPGSASSDTSFEFSMRFNISQVARADTTDWNATVHVYDDDTTPEVGYASETGLVTMNNYFGITISAATFSWGSAVQPNSINSTHGTLSITVYANAQWELRISASNFTASAETDITPETNDIIIWDEDGSAGGTSQWVRNTTATLPTGSTWDNQAAMSDENGLNRNVYILLNPGSLFTVGKQWSVIITIYVQANV